MVVELFSIYCNTYLFIFVLGILDKPDLEGEQHEEGIRAGQYFRNIILEPISLADPLPENVLKKRISQPQRWGSPWTFFFSLSP